MSKKVYIILQIVGDICLDMLIFPLFMSNAFHLDERYLGRIVCFLIYSVINSAYFYYGYKKVKYVSGATIIGQAILALLLNPMLMIEVSALFSALLHE